MKDCWSLFVLSCVSVMRWRFVQDVLCLCPKRDEMWMVRVSESTIMVPLSLGIGVIPNPAVSHTTRFHSRNWNVSAALTGIIKYLNKMFS